MAEFSFKSEGHRLVHKKIEEFIEPEHRLLDVGCGDGSFLDRLERSHDIRGTGIDPSVTAKSDTETDCTRLRAERADELQEKFDLIYSINSLHHFDDVSGFLSSVKSSLCESGKIILADWKEGAPTGITESYFSREEVSKMLKETGFEITESKEMEKQFLLVAETS